MTYLGLASRHTFLVRGKNSLYFPKISTYTLYFPIKAASL
jgi:hypothetical protein